MSSSNWAPLPDIPEMPEDEPTISASAVTAPYVSSPPTPNPTNAAMTDPRADAADEALRINSNRSNRNFLAESALRTHRHKLASNAFYQQEFQRRKNTPPTMVHPAFRPSFDLYDISKKLPELDLATNNTSSSQQQTEKFSSPTPPHMQDDQHDSQRDSNCTTMSPFLNAGMMVPSPPKLRRSSPRRGQTKSLNSSPELRLAPTPNSTHVPTMRQEVERRHEARMLDEVVDEYGDVIPPPRTSSLVMVEEDEYNIRAQRVREGIKRRLSEASQSDETVIRTEGSITPATTKKTFLQRMGISGRRSNTPEPSPSHMTSAPAPAHMAPKASAILMSPRVGFTAPSRLRTKNTGFFSRKHRSADEDDTAAFTRARDFDEGSPPKVPAGAAASLGRKPPDAPFTSIVRSRSLKYIDHTSPPTPPSKDTPPDGKTKAGEHTNISPSPSETPSRSVGFLSVDGDQSPSKGGTYAQRAIPRLVTQPSTHSLRASVVPDAMNATDFADMKSRISGLGLEGFSLPSETNRGGTPNIEYSPSVYSPEWRNTPAMEEFLSAEPPRLTAEPPRQRRYSMDTIESDTGASAFTYPEPAGDPPREEKKEDDEEEVTPTKSIPASQQYQISPFIGSTTTTTRGPRELSAMYNQLELMFDDDSDSDGDDDTALGRLAFIGSPMSQASAQPSPLRPPPSPPARPARPSPSVQLSETEVPEQPSAPAQLTEPSTLAPLAQLSEASPPTQLPEPPSPALSEPYPPTQLPESSSLMQRSKSPATTKDAEPSTPAQLSEPYPAVQLPEPSSVVQPAESPAPAQDTELTATAQLPRPASVVQRSESPAPAQDSETPSSAQSREASPPVKNSDFSDPTTLALLLGLPQPAHLSEPSPPVQVPASPPVQPSTPGPAAKSSPEPSPSAQTPELVPEPEPEPEPELGAEEFPPRGPVIFSQLSSDGKLQICEGIPKRPPPPAPRPRPWAVLQKAMPAPTSPRPSPPGPYGNILYNAEGLQILGAQTYVPPEGLQKRGAKKKSKWHHLPIMTCARPPKGPNISAAEWYELHDWDKNPPDLDWLFPANGDVYAGKCKTPPFSRIPCALPDGEEDASKLPLPISGNTSPASNKQAGSTDESKAVTKDEWSFEQRLYAAQLHMRSAPILTTQSGGGDNSKQTSPTRGMQYDSGIDVDPAKPRPRSAIPASPASELDVGLSSDDPIENALATAKSRETTLEKLVKNAASHNRRLDQRLVSIDIDDSPSEQAQWDLRMASLKKTDLPLGKSELPRPVTSHRRGSQQSVKTPSVTAQSADAQSVDAQSVKTPSVNAESVNAMSSPRDTPAAVRQGRKATPRKDHRRSTSSAKQLREKNDWPIESKAGLDESPTPDKSTSTAVAEVKDDEEPVLDLLSKDITPESLRSKDLLSPDLSDLAGPAFGTVLVPSPATSPVVSTAALATSPVAPTIASTTDPKAASTTAPTAASTTAPTAASTAAPAVAPPAAPVVAPVVASPAAPMEDAPNVAEEGTLEAGMDMLKNVIDRQEEVMKEMMRQMHQMRTEMRRAGI